MVKKKLEDIIKRLSKRSNKSVKMANIILEITYPISFCYTENTAKNAKEKKLTPEQLADGFSNLLSTHNPIYQSGSQYNQK